MEKYHINPATGNPSLCTASEESCPLGGDEQHYPTKEDAHDAYEASMGSQSGFQAPVSEDQPLQPVSPLSLPPTTTPEAENFKQKAVRQIQKMSDDPSEFAQQLRALSDQIVP